MNFFSTCSHGNYSSRSIVFQSIRHPQRKSDKMLIVHRLGHYERGFLQSLTNPLRNAFSSEIYL